MVDKQSEWDDLDEIEELGGAEKVVDWEGTLEKLGQPAHFCANWTYWTSMHFLLGFCANWTYLSLRGYLYLLEL